jgi:hypothetical protein
MQSDGNGLFLSGGSGIALRSLYIHGVAGNGVRAQAVNGCVVEDTVIRGSAISLNRGVNITIARCEVSQTDNSGIEIFGIPVSGEGGAPIYTVRDSHIHTVGQGLVSDFGGIYLAPADLQCWANNRTCAMPSLITNNIVHAIRQLGYGANALYLDAAASNVTVDSNLCYDTGGPAIYAHCGRANVVTGNVFAATNLQDHRAPWQGCDESGVGKMVAGQTMATHNVIAASGTAAVAGSTHNTAAWLKHSNTTHFDRNFYQPSQVESSMRFPPDLTFGQWQAQGQDEHSVMGDAGFVNAMASDYRLSTQSAARVLGIQGPDYATVGPRRTEALLRLGPPPSVFARYPFHLQEPVRRAIRWQQREATACRGVLPVNHSTPPVPCLLVPTCASGSYATAFDFRRNDGGGRAAQQTAALVCYDALGLSIIYSATDDNVESNSSHCHDHVWNADALEFMVYPGAMSADPGGNYSELDLSPKGGAANHARTQMICTLDFLV